MTIRPVFALKTYLKKKICLVAIKSTCQNGNFTMGNWDRCSIKPRSRHTKTRPYICMGDVERVEGLPQMII